MKAATASASLRRQMPTGARPEWVVRSALSAVVDGVAVHA